MSRGAESFDDPVLAGLRAELTEAQQTHIRLLRSANDEILVERTFPAQHHLDSGTPPFDHPTAVMHMFAAQEHFGLLRNPEGPNLVVPETDYHTILRPDGTAAIQGTRRYVEATPFGDYWNWPLYGNRAQFQPQAAQLAGSLVRYFVGIADNELDYSLGDIAGVHQWGVSPDNRAILLDDDPLVHELDPDKRRYFVGNSLRTVQAWARLIQPADVGEEMMDMIEEVIQSNDLSA